MSKRLVTDAKIVLGKAGYYVREEVEPVDGAIFLVVQLNENWISDIAIKHAMVNNYEVVDLLADRGFDQYGNKKKKPGN